MKRYILLAACACVLASCSTKYETVENKDISVKVRSIWADVDYDSRVTKCDDNLTPLEPLTEDGMEPIRELE